MQIKKFMKCAESQVSVSVKGNTEIQKGKQRMRVSLRWTGMRGINVNTWALLYVERWNARTHVDRYIDVCACSSFPALSCLKA